MLALHAMVALTLAAAGCQSGGGSSGGSTAAPPPAAKPSSVVSTATSPPDAECPAGGILVQSGIDSNANGVLDPEEVTVTQKVCNGSNGSNGGDGSQGPAGDQGPSGFTALVKLTDLSVSDPGPCYGKGGTKVELGLDNGDLGGKPNDGVLQTGEVDQTSYVCKDMSPGSLIAADPDGNIHTLNSATGVSTVVLPTFNWTSSQDNVWNSIGPINAMAYRPLYGGLIAGTGSGNSTAGSFYQIDLISGAGRWLGYASCCQYSTNSVEGMALRGDGTVFAAVYEEEFPQLGLVSVNTDWSNPSDVAIEDIGINPAVLPRGNGLTFDAAGNLFLADENGLRQLDPLGGDSIVIGSLGLSYTGFPAMSNGQPAITSMAFDPRFGQTYGIVEYTYLGEHEHTIYAYFLATVDLTTGEIVNIGQTTDRLDGLTYYPGILGAIPTYAVATTTFAPVTGTTTTELTPTGEGTNSADFANSAYVGDDELSGSLPIGFNFKFFGLTYSQFRVCANGYIRFDFETNASGCSPIASQDLPYPSTTDNNLIAGVWTHLAPSGGNLPSGGTITYETLGAAPSRKLVVQWNGVPLYDSACNDRCGYNGDGILTMQIILYEGTSAIDVHTTAFRQDSGTGQEPAVQDMVQAVENAGGTAAAYLDGRMLPYAASGYTTPPSLTSDAVRFTVNP